MHFSHLKRRKVAIFLACLTGLLQRTQGTHLCNCFLCAPHPVSLPCILELVCFFDVCGGSYVFLGNRGLRCFVSTLLFLGHIFQAWDILSGRKTMSSSLTCAASASMEAYKNGRAMFYKVYDLLKEVAIVVFAGLSHEKMK